jgi:hypothetical protein
VAFRDTEEMVRAVRCSAYDDEEVLAFFDDFLFFEVTEGAVFLLGVGFEMVVVFHMITED